MCNNSYVFKMLDNILNRGVLRVYTDQWMFNKFKFIYNIFAEWLLKVLISEKTRFLMS